jgi:hypothetical protein
MPKLQNLFEFMTVLFWGAALGSWIEGGAWCRVLIVFLAGSLFCAGWVWLIIAERIWPGRDGWRGKSSTDTSDTVQNSVSSDRRRVWQSPNPQHVGDFFEVDFGKARSVESISIFEDDGAIEKPGSWRVMFFGKDDGILSHKDGQDSIILTPSDLPKRPIQRFRIEIKEVTDPVNPDTTYAKKYGQFPHWTISYIRVKEFRIRLFGKGFFSHAV